MQPSAIGIGCNKIAALSRDRREVTAMLNEAMDQGINFFDTADDYSYGDSERLLGKVMRGRRDQAIICSKAGHTRGSLRHIGKFAIPLVKKMVHRWKPLRRTAVSAAAGVPGGRNFEPQYIAHCIENTLRRLNTDYLDLFLLHGPTFQDIADGTLFEALEGLRDRGLIRYYGISCQRSLTANDAVALLDLPGLSSLQIPVHPRNTAVIDAIRDTAEKGGVGLVAREVFIDGAIFDDLLLRDAPAKHPDRSPAQTALQFTLQVNSNGPVLVGVTNRKHLAENIDTLSKPPLTEADIEELRTLGQSKPSS